MAEFRSVEIDFDIHKLIESQRRNFSETPNDVLRRLLRLKEQAAPTPSIPKDAKKRPWTGEGVSLPHGTKIKMSYNQQQYEGEILDGKWCVEGATFHSPSGAASGSARTKDGESTRLDGWNYWHVKRPADTKWVKLRDLRRTMTLDDLASELGL